MKTFVMHLQSATQYERVENVASFVGEDGSGSFGIRARHARTMTALTYGLARYRLQDNGWRYLAFPRGILYFADNALYISTRRFLHDADYQRISKGLLEQLLKEEEELRTIRESLHRLEQEMFRRLWQMGRRGAGP
ncbi:F0F1 ATP synthase subunit epsilon [Candidatus Ferrigenium straubiae]|jgi:F-type H+-transporting ATPase subunit epsilon|uniref:F0F1 ATP synthase subunit epsilon n=1 Tax=Candidatus Ferrigenium straubiae TaxID=2919506 RepID=UPI003F4ADDC6